MCMNVYKKYVGIILQVVTQPAKLNLCDLFFAMELLLS